MVGNKIGFKKLLTISAFFVLITSVSIAQQNTTQKEPVEKLEERLKNDYFSLGLLVQGTATYQPERISGHNGLAITYSRFKVSGIFNKSFGYKMQATILESPALIDANVYYQPTSNFSIKLGIFKSPFSYEYDTGAGSTPFVDRSTVVNSLDPKRELGVQVDASTKNNAFRFMGGIFNGDNNGSFQNADDDFQYIVRAESNLLGNDSANSVLIGANFSYEENDWLIDQGGIKSERTLLGSYAIISQGKLSFDAEFIYSWLKPELGPEQNLYGYYATAGYQANSKSQFLLRWDSFAGDNILDDSESIIAGFNFSPSKYTRLELNYILPTDRSAEYSNFKAALQVSF